jgi:hypothetical protein
MIYHYIGLTQSYIGSTATGLTFSSIGVQVGGINGMPSVFTVASHSSSVSGNTTPIIFMNAVIGIGSTRTYTLPSSPLNGTTITIRRVEVDAEQGVSILGGGTDLIRLRTSSTGTTSVPIGATDSNCKRFFYFKGTGTSGIWWEI